MTLWVMDRGTGGRWLPVHRGNEATERDLPTPTPQFRRRAWRVFQRALDPLRIQVRVVSALVLLSLALAISGAVLAQANLWRGSTLSLTGIGSLLGFLSTALRLSRDQALLELIPAKYELAFELSKSPRQLNRVLAEFLKEMSALQPK